MAAYVHARLSVRTLLSFLICAEGSIACETTRWKLRSRAYAATASDRPRTTPTKCCGSATGKLPVDLIAPEFPKSPQEAYHETTKFFGMLACSVFILRHRCARATSRFRLVRCTAIGEFGFI